MGVSVTETPPPDRDPPTETPLLRPPWTDPLDRYPPGQRPKLPSPMDRHTPVKT